MSKKSFPPKIILLIALIIFNAKLFSATFNVSDVSGFQTALTTAQSNGEDDTVNVAAGTYNVSSTLTYDTSENNSLTISGAGSSTTILDGGGSVKIMNLNGTGTGNISVSGLTFQNGRATTGIPTGGGLGGGLVITNSITGNIALDNCTISSNTSTTSAAGAYLGLVDGDATVTNSTFTNNSCDEGTSDDGCGLYIYFDTADSTGNATVRNNTISNNTLNRNPSPIGNCDGAGMMIYHLGTSGTAPTTTIENNTFSNNTSYEGAAGVSLHLLHRETVLVLNGNTFSGNVSGPLPSGVEIAIYGGGIHTYVDGGSMTITNNQFLDNRNLDINGLGAGLCLDNLPEGSVQLSNNVFAGNQCAGLGGGAVVNPGSGVTSANIAGNLFVNNQAGATEGTGGGISIAADCDVTLVNNTFYGNTASGGGGIGYYTEGSGRDLTITNDIYRNNTPEAISNMGSGTIAATYSNVEGASGQSWFGTGCIDSDPTFTDAANPAGSDGTYGTADDGLHLAIGSPCIDTGSNTAVPSFLSSDLTGADRIQNNTVDMGAYEGTSGTVTPYLSLSISPSTISENAGTATATVTRGGTENTEALSVSVSSSETTAATVPEAVTISAGENSATFTVTAVDDSTEDGTQTSIITASADGFRSGTATITVTDNDGGDSTSLTIGSILTIEPNDLTDFNGTTFPRKPKVVATYDDPVKNREGRASMKVYYDSDNNESIICEWKKKIALFNKRAIDSDQTTEEYIASLTDGVIPNLSLDLQITAADDNGDKATYEYSGTVNLVPPVITQVTDEDGNVITSAAAGETVILTGTYFGTKKMSVWLEYRDDNNRVKIKKCRILTGDDYQLYEDHNGKPSFMNIQTGASTVYFQIPPRFPSGWDDNSTEHNIVLDNKIGRTSIDFTTTE